MVIIVLEEAAIEIREAGAGEGEEVALAVFLIEGFEEEGGEVFRVEEIGFLLVSGKLEELLEEVFLPALPNAGAGGAAEPAFFLEEGEKDEAAEEGFDEVADRFVGLAGLVVVIDFGDLEEFAGVVDFIGGEKVADEDEIMFLVAFKKLLAEGFYRESEFQIPEGEIGVLLGEIVEPVGGIERLAIFAQKEGVALRGGLDGGDLEGVLIERGGAGRVSETPVGGILLVEDGKDTGSTSLIDKAGDVVTQSNPIPSKLDLAGSGDLENGDGLIITGESEGAELEGGGDLFVRGFERLGSLEESQGAFGEEVDEERLPSFPIVGLVKEFADFGGIRHRS